MFLKDGKEPPGKTQFRMDQGFFQGDHGKVFPPGDAGNLPRLGQGFVVADNQRTGGLRVVGIPDPYRDAGLADGEDRLILEDAGAHISQLPQFAVGNPLNRFRVFDDPGIRHQETGDIGPVFIDRRLNPAGNDGSGDIRTAARKSLNPTVGQGAIKTGDNSPRVFGQAFADRFPGALGVVGPVGIKKDNLRRVNKIIPQKFSQDQAAKELPPAGRVIGGRPGGDLLLNPGQALPEIERKPQFMNDLQVTVGDNGEYIVKRLALPYTVVTKVKQIRDLLVVGVPLARSGIDDVTPLPSAVTISAPSGVSGGGQRGSAGLY